MIPASRYAYTTLATAARPLSIMANPIGGPLSLSQLPPQATLKKEDYPDVEFWDATSWNDSKVDKDIFTTSPRHKKKGTFWFLEDANGAPLSEERCNAVTKRARQIFAHLNASGAGATKWGEMGNVSQDYYRNEKYSLFPELRLCELDWKANRLATETYSSWYRKCKDKLATGVKQEDRGDSENDDVNGGSSSIKLNLHFDTLKGQDQLSNQLHVQRRLNPMWTSQHVMTNGLLFLK